MINLKDQNADDILNDQPVIVEEGYYKISLVNYTPSEWEGVTTHQMKWQVVAAQPHLQSERGKYLTEFWKEGKVFPKLFLRAGLACGIYTETQVRDLCAAGEMPVPDFEQWIGHSCVCRVSHNTWQNKTYARVGFDFFAPDSDVAREANILVEEDLPI